MSTASSLHKPILPGSKIGVLGSGQLGRMFAIAARKMGYRVHTFSPDSDTPTGQVADVEVTASYDDLDAVKAFARQVDAVTFEFENVPVDAANAAAELVPVRPAGSVLHTTQHRLREKQFLEKSGIPVAPFRVVRTMEELPRALYELGTPAILKTAGFGYDGKGQARIPLPEMAEKAWNAIGGQEAVLEKHIEFRCEISVVAARGADGSFVHYGTVENQHSNHILDITIAPARVSETVTKRAVEIAREILDKLDVVGVLCVELFVTHDDQLMVNELAPRPHNSGHYTFDACITSQFEQQLRAVCGLPLGSPEQLRPAAMANLLGDLWYAHRSLQEPNWASTAALGNVKIHLYGKVEPRRGRKMGHLTALAGNIETALSLVQAARDRLTEQ